MKEIDGLEIKPADPTISVPLHQQVYLNLLRMILSGQLIVGDTLPPEIKLSEAYHVSRQTMRDAMKKLEIEKMIKRTAGSGTVVLEKKSRIQYFLELSLSNQLNNLEKALFTDVIRLRPCFINSKSPDILQSKMKSKAMELGRLHYIDGIPSGILFSTVIIDACPDIIYEDFRSNSLYELLLVKYNFSFSRVEQTVETVLSDSYQQALLKINKPIPLLLVKTNTYLENDEPIESTTAYLVSEHYKIHIAHTYA